MEERLRGGSLAPRGGDSPSRNPWIAPTRTLRRSEGLSASRRSRNDEDSRANRSARARGRDGGGFCLRVVASFHGRASTARTAAGRGADHSPGWACRRLGLAAGEAPVAGQGSCGGSGRPTKSRGGSPVRDAGGAVFAGSLEAGQPDRSFLDTAASAPEPASPAAPAAPVVPAGRATLDGQ